MPGNFLAFGLCDCTVLYQITEHVQYTNIVDVYAHFPLPFHDIPAQYHKNGDRLIRAETAVTAAIPGASDIETRFESRFTPVFDTTSPGDRAKAQTAAGSTAPRDSHPRQDLCRPPSIRQDGSIIVADGILAIQLAIGCFSDGWEPLGTLRWPSFMEAFREIWSPLCIPASTGGLRASSGVACLPRQEAPPVTYLRLRIFSFQGTARENRKIPLAL